MKKILLIIVLLFSMVSYSQEKQSVYKKRLEKRVIQLRIEFETLKVSKNFKMKIKKELFKASKRLLIIKP